MAMPQMIGDVAETLKEHSGKAIKEIASTPVDIIKASFGDEVIPNPSAQRKQEIKAKDTAETEAIRRNLRAEVDAMRPKQEQPRIQQGEALAEQGKGNQNAAMNNLQGQPLSSSMTPKKKLEPLVVQQKRNNKLHGAG